MQIITQSYNDYIFIISMFYLPKQLDLRLLSWVTGSKLVILIKKNKRKFNRTTADNLPVVQFIICNKTNLRSGFDADYKTFVCYIQCFCQSFRQSRTEFGEWYLFVKIDKTKNIDKANIDTPSLPAALRQTRAS